MRAAELFHGYKARTSFARNDLAGRAWRRPWNIGTRVGAWHGPVDLADAGRWLACAAAIAGSADRAYIRVTGPTEEIAQWCQGAR